MTILFILTCTTIILTLLIVAESERREAVRLRKLAEQATLEMLARCGHVNRKETPTNGQA